MNIAFAENRSSDDIVVYIDKEFFDMQGNLPTEFAHKNRKMFRSEEEAVEYIVSKIEEFKNESSALSQIHHQSITN